VNPQDRQPHIGNSLGSRHLKAEKILAVLGLGPRDPPWRVLEIGTGTGGIAHYLGTHSRVRCDVTSVDVVDLRQVREGYSFQRIQDTRLPFGDGTFDVVITNHVIEHVGDRDAQLAHLRECRRVLADAGRGYLAVPSRWMLVEPHFHLPLLSWLPRPWRSAYVRLARRGQRYDCEPLTVGELHQLFDAAGLGACSATVVALRQTLAIEGTRGLVRTIASRLPDWLWQALASWMPTLIYVFNRPLPQAPR
jgi:SAM-dependent methyltransferase